MKFETIISYPQSWIDPSNPEFWMQKESTVEENMFEIRKGNTMDQNNWLYFSWINFT